MTKLIPKKNFPYLKKQITKRLKLPPGNVTYLVQRPGSRGLYFYAAKITAGPYLTKIKKRDIYSCGVDKDLRTITEGSIHCPHTPDFY